MKPLYLLLKNIKNLAPYLALISLYFFFVNIEANKNNNSQRSLGKDRVLSDDSIKGDEKVFRVVIPVIPYNQ